MEERITQLERMIADIRFTLENHKHTGFDGTKQITTSSSSSSTNVSGTYTPTSSGGSNVDAVFTAVSQYFRINDFVVVSGALEIDTTSTTFTEFNLSLPIASDFSSGIDASGVFISGTPSQSMAGMITADETNNNVKFKFFSNNQLLQGYRFIFMYKVI